MLAMKARAARGKRDLDDLWILCQIIGLVDVEQVWAICEEVWGDDLIREDTRILVNDDLRRRLGHH